MAQSKQGVLPNTSMTAKVEGGREGENPDAASPSEARPRNSSGAASMAASLLDLRVHINAIEQVLYELKAMQILPSDAFHDLERLRQRGFRRGR